MTAVRAFAIAALSFGSSACGFGLLQTAKTLPPGSGAITVGGGLAHNEIIEERLAGSDLPFAGFIDLNLRVGLTEQLDVGAGFLGVGGRLDAKYNLIDAGERLALSPRIGAGYGISAHGSSAITAHIGGLVSYDVAPWFTPYGGMSFANYWMDYEPDDPPRLAPDENLASRAGYGDGVVELRAGVAFRLAKGSQLFVEYGRFAPAQNDLGDRYSFVGTDLVVVGWQIPLFGWKNARP